MFEDSGVQTLAVGRENRRGEYQITMRQLSRALRDVPQDAPVAWSDGMSLTCISACAGRPGDVSIGSAWGTTPAEGLREEINDAARGVLVDDEGDTVEVTGDTLLWRADPGERTDEIVTAIYYDGVRVLIETGEAE